MCWFFIWENFDIISTCEKEFDEKHKLREFVLCMRVLTPAFGFLASASREIFSALVLFEKIEISFT